MKTLGAWIGIGAAIWLGAWLANIGPWGVDLGLPGERGLAFTIDVALVLLFGLQHSVMARPAFKRRIETFLPSRAVYLVGTAVALAILFAAWRPLQGIIWQLPSSVALGQAGGLMLVTWAVAALDARAFLGLRLPPMGLQTTGPYRFRHPLLRHPIMIGTVLVLWCVPKMTEGHALFSAAMTVYAVIGTMFESRDLARDGGGARLARSL